MTVLIEEPEPSASAEHELEFGASTVRNHAVWAVAGRFTSLTSAMVSTVLLARVMEPADFGRFNILRTGLTMFGTLAAFGLGTITLKRLGARQMLGGAATAFRPVRRLSITVGILSGLLSLIVFLFAGPTALNAAVSWQLAVALMIGVIAIAWGEVWTQAARGLNATAFSNMSGGLRGGALQNVPFLLLGVTCYAIIPPLSWQNAAFLYCGVAVFSALTAILVVRRKIAAAERFTSSVVDDERILAAAWPLAVVTLLSFTATQADQFFAAGLGSELETANYIAARRVIYLLSIPLSVLNIWLSGIIGALLASRDIRRLQRLMQLGATAAGVPCLLMTLACTCAPALVLRVLLGSAYATDAAANYLRILSFGQAILVLTGGCGLLLSLSSNQRTLLVITSVSSAIILGGGPWVASYLGGTGLAWMTSLVVAVGNIVTWWIAWRRMSINTAASLQMVGSLPQLCWRGDLQCEKDR